MPRFFYAPSSKASACARDLRVRCPALADGFSVADIVMTTVLRLLADQVALYTQAPAAA